MSLCDHSGIRDGKSWADVGNKNLMNPTNNCSGCIHAINLQGYSRVCNSPAKLEQFKRFHYVERMPDGTCHQGTVLLARPSDAQPLMNQGVAEELTKGQK